MREMLCGVEFEFGLRCDVRFFKESFRGNPSVHVDEILNQMSAVLPSEWFVQTPSVPPDLSEHAGSLDIWTRGGMRCYKDQQLLEVATAECGTFKELVFQKNVAERLVLALVLRARDRLRQPPYSYEGPLEAYADNVARDPDSEVLQETTHGCHENYLLRRDLFKQYSLKNSSADAKYRRILNFAGPFFAALPVLAGTGHITLDGKFILSPRLSNVAMGIGGSTTSSRAVVNTRDEAHADNEKFFRYHHIAGDVNITDNIFEMKTAFTYWVLRLLERGWEPPKWLRMPEQKLRDVAFAVNSDPRIEKISPWKFSAVDILAGYLKAVDSWRRDLMFDEEDDAIFLRIQDYLEKARSGPEALLGVSEWATKRDILLRQMRRRNIFSFDDRRLRMIAIGLHSIDTDFERNPIVKIRNNELPANMDIGDLVKASRVAPRTRAYVRGLAVFLVKLYGFEVVLGHHGWAEFTVTKQPFQGPSYNFKFNNTAPWELGKRDIEGLISWLRPLIAEKGKNL